MNEFDNINSENGENEEASGAGGIFDEGSAEVFAEDFEEDNFDNSEDGSEADEEAFVSENHERVNGAASVVFEEDGTYHTAGGVSSAGARPETGAPYQGNPNSGNNGAYPYGQRPGVYGGYNPNEPSQYGRNNPGAGGYRPPQRPVQGGAFRSQGGSPYRPQGGAAPGGQNSANGGGYPYGQNNANGGGYPYGQNAPTGANGGYPYGSPNQGPTGYRPPSEPYKYAYPGSVPPGKKKKGGMKIFAGIAAALFVFIVIALIAVVSGDKNVNLPEEQTTTGVVSENVDEITTNASPETDAVDSKGAMMPKSIYQKVLPSSVGILVYDRSKTLASEGTGVLFSESEDSKYTYIVTCAHVINKSVGVISVQLYDGKKYDADIVGFDTRTDIGVLRIEASGLNLAEIGDSSKVFVGDYVYAIGNPGGVEFANSFTDGIVSALDRPVNSSDTGYTTECIQHTAAINPGNSGGALVNSFGQVIGINSMKIIADEYEGMGFSVPSSVFVDVVNELLKNGYVSNRPKLGITYVAASEYSTYGMFVTIKGLPAGSIIIYDISADSSFKGTEVRKGDMIVAVNGKGLDDASYLSKTIEESKVGDRLTLSIVRVFDDYTFEEFDVTVTLVEDKGGSIASDESDRNSLLPDESQGGNSSSDYFNEYFEDYFNEYFGVNP